MRPTVFTYRLPSRKTYEIEYDPSPGFYIIRVLKHPPCSHPLGVSAILEPTNVISVAQGREPRTLERAKAIAMHWICCFESYRQTGIFEKRPLKCHTVTSPSKSLGISEDSFQVLESSDHSLAMTEAPKKTLGYKALSICWAVLRAVLRGVLEVLKGLFDFTDYDSRTHTGSSPVYVYSPQTGWSCKSASGSKKSSIKPLKPGS